MSFIKVPIYRNPKLLALAKEAPYCFRCRKHPDGTIVPSHANAQEMGKGYGLKASDAPIAFVCHDCHAWIDKPENGKEAQAEWYRAACLSMRWALENHPEVFK